MCVSSRFACVGLDELVRGFCEFVKELRVTVQATLLVRALSVSRPFYLRGNRCGCWVGASVHVHRVVSL